MPNVTTTQKTELEPAVAERIRALLGTYFELKMQYDLLEAQMDVEKTKIWDILKDAGVKSANVDGTPCTVIEGTTAYLDKEEFVLLGGDLKVLAHAMKSRPKKAYIQIGKDKSHA